VGTPHSEDVKGLFRAARVALRKALAEDRGGFQSKRWALGCQQPCQGLHVDAPTVNAGYRLPSVLFLEVHFIILKEVSKSS